MDLSVQEIRQVIERWANNCSDGWGDSLTEKMDPVALTDLAVMIYTAYNRGGERCESRS